MQEDFSATGAERRSQENRPEAWQENRNESWRKGFQDSWQEMWKAFCSFSQMGSPRLERSPEAMRQLAAIVSRWNRELVEFGVKRAYEYTRLPERLVDCHSTPDILRLEMDYLEIMYQHYSEEFPRLLKLGDEVARLSIAPWNLGSQLAEEHVGRQFRIPISSKESERGESRRRDDSPQATFASAE